MTIQAATEQDALESLVDRIGAEAVTRSMEDIFRRMAERYEEHNRQTAQSYRRFADRLATFIEKTKFPS